MVERLSKVEIILNSHYKSADAVTSTLRKWLQGVPRHLFKSITFDNGKEFAGYVRIIGVNSK
ncbi:IS30 family transposase [Limosilactobacillus fermentum]|nr:IS30 family transposase [Limosilactobacillus fermentum]